VAFGAHSSFRKPFFFKKPPPTKATPAPTPVGATPPKVMASSEEGATTPPPGASTTPKDVGSAIPKAKRMSISMDRRFSVSDILFGSSEEFSGEAPTALEFVLKSFLGQWLAQADAKLREFTQSTVSDKENSFGG
jgi:hypothetical protein